MAISHLCHQCGWDLAHVRPVREPHYGLRLITCPRCAAKAVRRRHPITAAVRKFRRLDLTITVLGVQFTLIALLGGLTAATSFGMLDAAMEIAIGERPNDLLWTLFWPLVVIGPLTGAWLTAGFPHVQRWRAFAGWLAFMSLGLMSGWLVAAIGECLQLEGADRNAQSVLLIAGGGFSAQVSSIVAMLLTAIAGVPIGWMILRLTSTARHALWRSRRRRFRHARSA